MRFIRPQPEMVPKALVLSDKKRSRDNGSDRMEPEGIIYIDKKPVTRMLK